MAEPVRHWTTTRTLLVVSIVSALFWLGVYLIVVALT